MSEQPRIRRNIDTLTPEELADYQHAFAKLIEISDHDPDSIDGYTYLEQLHDGSLGPCEHANDTFLPWHRAHLYLFEEALRRSDPPRTSNVTLPYWDWSALPSGKRYPVAFEDRSSVLYDPTRHDQQICRPPGESGCQRLPFPRQYLESSVLSVSAWSSPPGAQPPPNFGGVAGGESDCSSPFGHGFGALEQPAHNTMHNTYIAGDMLDPSSAALDPIFWSFHAYIDLLWSQWQQQSGHEVDTDLEARLCGLFKDREHQPANRFKVKDVLDPATDLGYTYLYTPGSPPPSSDHGEGERLFATHPAVDFVMSGRKAPELVRSLDVAVPQPGIASARLVVTGLKIPSSFSYGVDLYLTPAGEEFRPEDVEFRERYLVNLLFVWRHHHHHDPSDRARHDQPEPSHAVNAVVDIGPAIGSLAKTRPGQPWRLWVAMTAVTDDLGDGAAAGGGLLFRASAGRGRDNLAQSMEPDDLTLTVR
jgi:tyrosinase